MLKSPKSHTSVKCKTQKTRELRGELGVPPSLLIFIKALKNRTLAGLKFDAGVKVRQISEVAIVGLFIINKNRLAK